MNEKQKPHEQLENRKQLNSTVTRNKLIFATGFAIAYIIILSIVFGDRLR